jgi:hypothetical protein
MMKLRVWILIILGLTAVACATRNTPPLPTIAPTEIIATRTNTPPPTQSAATPTAPPAPTRVFTSAATINAQIENSTRALSPIFFGYNNGAEAIRDGLWRDPAYQRAVAGLKPGTLRYPAGTVANYWDWEKAWFFPNDRFGMYKLAPTPNRLEDFQQTLDAAGATPVFDLNLLTSNLDSQLAMLRHAQKLGLAIRYVELGNEFYLNWDDNARAFPTGADYARVCNRWIDAIKTEFPGALVAVVGAPPRSASSKDARLAQWNAQLFANIRNADALTVHIYDNAGIGKTDTFKSSDVPTMLGAPFSVWTQLQNELGKIPAGMQVWITEFNLMDHNAPTHGTWAHGLFVATESMLFLDNPKIALIEPHAISGNAIFGAVFSNERAFNFGGDFISPNKQIKTTPLAPSAMGTTLALFAQATRDQTATQKIVFAPNPTVRGKTNNAYPTLLGRVFTSTGERSGIIINLSGDAYALNLGSLGFRSFDQVYADPITLIATPRDVTRVTGTISSALTLPPYSVTRLSGQ